MAHGGHDETKNIDPAMEANYLALLVLSSIGGHLDSPERLLPADCFLVAHAEALQGIHDEWKENRSREQLAIVSRLEARGQATAAAIVKGMRSGAIEYFDADVIAERLSVLASRRRKRSNLANALLAFDQDRHEDVRHHIAKIGAVEKGGVDIITAKETAERAIASLIQRPDRARGRTGYPIADDAVGGLPRGSMLTIGGTTGAGKSSLALGLCMNSIKQGRRPGIISIEDPEEVWGPRFLAHVCGINDEDFHGGRINASFFADAEIGINAANGMGLYFGFAMNRPLAEVLAAIRKAVLVEKCDLIVVDYIQAVLLDTKAPRHVAVAHAAQSIKGLCQELGVALVLCSQLSRADKTKPNAEPNNSHLKESGDLENMSEIIVLLWKENDEDNARTLGKVSKVKWSPKRPRFFLERAPNGAVCGLAKRETPNHNPRDLPEDQ